MKKTYEAPEANVVRFDENDAVMTIYASDSEPCPDNTTSPIIIG